MTHCSECGRKIRPVQRPGWVAPNHSFPLPWTDYLNHSRDCPRYGQAPDR